ncbi:MAG TPA: hypothetical protein VF545_11855 [Thermoleophilaceae bacterium]
MEAKSGIDTREPVEGRSLRRTLAEKPAAVLLVLLMAAGSVFLWLVIPLAWVWIASHSVETTQPTLGPYLLILFGVPVSMYIVGKLLYRLNHVYERVTGQVSEVRVQLPWHRSMRGEREVARRTTVLELVMICSVSVALVLFGIWFFFIAGSSLPNP